jgi:hypothetical protein
MLIRPLLETFGSRLSPILETLTLQTVNDAWRGHCPSSAMKRIRKSQKIARRMRF